MSSRPVRAQCFGRAIVFPHTTVAWPNNITHTHTRLALGCVEWRHQEANDEHEHTQQITNHKQRTTNNNRRNDERSTNNKQQKQTTNNEREAKHNKTTDDRQTNNIQPTDNTTDRTTDDTRQTTNTPPPKQHQFRLPRLHFFKETRIVFSQHGRRRWLGNCSN